MSSYMVGKDISALVADIGSFSTKIGYAGDDHPQAVYNSTTAVERRWSAGAGTVVAAAAAEDGHRYSNSNFVRGPQRDFATRCINNKDNNDGNYTLANPVDPVTGWIFSPPSRSVTGRGRIGSSSSSSPSSSSPSSFSSNENNNHVGDNTNLGDEWESHELVSRYLEHAFHNALGIGMGRGGSGGSGMDDDDVVSHHPLLLLDKPHTPPALRQRMLEILFETHHLPAVFFLRDAVASCYAVGRTTATVVDMGYSSAMVTPVYEGFVENRGVLRNNACGAKYVDERVLALMDDIVKKQGGRRRKDRMRRMNQRRLEQKAAAAAAASNSGGGGDNNTNHATDSNNSNNSPSKQQQQQPQQQRTASTTLKRDAAGHFIKESNNNNNNASLLAPIPDYLMPLYQVRRAPTYTTRSDPFHNWARITLAREIKEMGLGVAVGPMGYVSSASAAAAATTATSATAAAGGAEGGGATPNTVPDAATIQHSINPASANNVFLTSSKLPYTLPDGTAVEITTSSRCDVAELYFGNDDLNNIYRDNIFDETVQRMEEYEKEIEDFLVDSGGDGNGGGGEGGGVESSSRKPTTNSSSSISSSRGGDAGDAYSNTSYRGEKANRHSFGGGGGGRRRTYYPPSTISKKLYSACLPYLRTTPPNIHNSDGMDMGSGGGEGVVSGASGTSGSMNENYFHYLTSASPAQMVCDAAFRCDRDQQASLLGNVVVCGGGACITGVAGVGAAAGGPLGVVGGAGLPAAGSGGVVGGVMASLLGDEHAFPDRLREEIEAIVHRHTPGWRVKVTSPNVSERAICSWLGGSILGSLSTFQDMWISRKDYEEYGAAIVNRKCP